MADIIIGGYNFSSMNYSLIAYCLFAIFVMGYGTFTLYSPDTLARTALFLIGGVLVFVFFWMRWFGNATAPSGVWPPTINMCPDYLTYVNTITGAGLSGTSTGACVDMLGVSSNGTLKVSAKSDLPSLTATNVNKVFPYTSADVASSTSTAETIQRVCSACESAGVTWEGIYDGDTCIAINRYLTAAAVNLANGCPA